MKTRFLTRFGGLAFLLVALSLVAFKTSDDLFRLGSGSAGNKRIIFDIGGNNPEIRWNSSASALQFSNDGSSYASVASGDAVSGANLLINSDFRVAQQGTSFTSATTPANSDDTYLFDQWVLLSDGNDIVDVTRSTIAPTGAVYSMKLDVETANKKAGVIQFLEQAAGVGTYGGTVSLSFQARKGASNTTVDTLRAAVLSWDGTADTVTSDVVSAWGAEGTNPTLVSNWTYENTATNLTLTNSFQTFTVQNISVDTASVKNLAVFIWIDNADGTVTDEVYISNVKLEIGATATQYIPKAIAQEFVDCERFFQTSYDNTAPGTVTTLGSYTFRASGANADVPVQLRPMRIAPAVTLYNPSSGATGSWRDSSASADVTFTANHIGTRAFEATSTGTTDGRAIQGHWTANARL